MIMRNWNTDIWQTKDLKGDGRYEDFSRLFLSISEFSHVLSTDNSFVFGSYSCEDERKEH